MTRVLRGLLDFTLATGDTGEALVDVEDTAVSAGDGGKEGVAAALGERGDTAGETGDGNDGAGDETCLTMIGLVGSLPKAFSTVASSSFKMK